MITPQSAIQKGKLLENYVSQEIRKKRLDTLVVVVESGKATSILK